MSSVISGNSCPEFHGYFLFVLPLFRRLTLVAFFEWGNFSGSDFCADILICISILQLTCARVWLITFVDIFRPNRQVLACISVSLECIRNHEDLVPAFLFQRFGVVFGVLSGPYKIQYHLGRTGLLTTTLVILVYSSLPVVLTGGSGRL